MKKKEDEQQPQEGQQEKQRQAPYLRYRYSRFSDEHDGIHHAGEVVFGAEGKSVRLARVSYDRGKLVAVQFKLGSLDELLEEQKKGKLPAEQKGILLKFGDTTVELINDEFIGHVVASEPLGKTLTHSSIPYRIMIDQTPDFAIITRVGVNGSDPWKFSVPFRIDRPDIRRIPITFSLPKTNTRSGLPLPV